MTARKTHDRPVYAEGRDFVSGRPSKCWTFLCAPNENMTTPACDFTRYMPQGKGCTPSDCDDTEAFCKKFFQNDMANCVQYASASPSTLVKDAKTVKQLQSECCVTGMLNDTNPGCAEGMTSSCKWVNGSPGHTEYIGTNPTHCVQKDRNAVGENCTRHTTQTACADKDACMWNATSQFDLKACSKTPAFEHSAGIAYPE